MVFPSRLHPILHLLQYCGRYEVVTYIWRSVCQDELWTVDEINFLPFYVVEGVISSLYLLLAALL